MWQPSGWRNIQNTLRLHYRTFVRHGGASNHQQHRCENLKSRKIVRGFSQLIHVNSGSVRQKAKTATVHRDPNSLFIVHRTARGRWIRRYMKIYLLPETAGYSKALYGFLHTKQLFKHCNVLLLLPNEPYQIPLVHKLQAASTSWNFSPSIMQCGAQSHLSPKLSALRANVKALIYWSRTSHVTAREHLMKYLRQKFSCQKTGCTLLNEVFVTFEAQVQLNSIYKGSSHLTENTGSPLQGRIC